MVGKRHKRQGSPTKLKRHLKRISNKREIQFVNNKLKQLKA